MWQEFSYTGPEDTRSYFVYTPQGYQADVPAPLLVMLHGCRQTPEDFAAGTQMNALADRHRFVVVYPKQPTASNHQRCWNWFQATNHLRGSGEPALIVGIVQAVIQSTANWTIDPARLYVAGLSAGGALAGILGCTYPDVFAAVGIHSGIVYQAATSMEAGLKAMRSGGPDPERQGQLAFQAMGSLRGSFPLLYSREPAIILLRRSMGITWCSNGCKPIAWHLAAATLLILQCPAVSLPVRCHADEHIRCSAGTTRRERKYKPIGESPGWAMPGRVGATAVPILTPKGQAPARRCMSFLWRTPCLGQLGWR